MSIDLCLIFGYECSNRMSIDLWTERDRDGRGFEVDTAVGSNASGRDRLSVDEDEGLIG